MAVANVTSFTAWYKDSLLGCYLNPLMVERKAPYDEVGFITPSV